MTNMAALDLPAGRQMVLQKGKNGLYIDSPDRKNTCTLLLKHGYFLEQQKMSGGQCCYSLCFALSNMTDTCYNLPLILMAWRA
eukprot:scaffold166583_cov17-Tisochrysis_lutea.AAC.1